MASDSSVLSFWEPKRKFRWVLNLPGFDSFMFHSVRSVGGGQTEVSYHIREDVPLTEFPDLSGGNGQLKLLDADGNILEEYELAWASAEHLPFDLDYSSSEPMRPRILLYGSKLRKV